MIEYLDTTDSGYRPGVCNIGPAEIERRRQIGWLGLAGSVVLAALLLAVAAPPLALLLVVIPAAAAVSGFLQAHLRFCAGYGLAGMQNLGELGQQQRIEDAAEASADLRRAMQIHAVSIAVGLTVALALVLASV